MASGRRVARRFTFRRVTRGAPWSWRATFDRGAPRTCLSHHRQPIHYRVDEEHVYRIGDYDWLLRLYQHTGFSRQSVRPGEEIAYFEEEWNEIRSLDCEWIEFVDTQRETVSRIDFGTASRYGSWKPTPRGYMWHVPLDLYTTLE